MIWRRWFAWYPVRTFDGRWVWLHDTWRRKQQGRWVYVTRPTS